MEASFTFSASAILTAVALAVGMVLVFGALATWRVLGARAAAQLRDR